MNHSIKTAVLTAGCSLLLASARAQPIQGTEVKPFYPVRAEEDIISDLFQIPEAELNYNFTTVLPGGNYMMIGFRRLSDWRPEANLSGIMAVAGHVLEGYRDSLHADGNSRKMDLHIPISNAPVTSRFSSSVNNTNLITESGGKRSLLKIGMDTLRILKNIARRPATEDKAEKLVQVQYTFLLKDISQFRELVRDTQWIAQTVATYDSLVAARRSKWKRQDAWFHYMYVKLDQNETEKKKRLQYRTSLRSETQFYGNRIFGIDGGIGVLLVRNDLCPNIDLGASWNFYSNKEETAFTRISLNSFMRFEQLPDKKFQPYTTSFINAELGFRSAKVRLFLPFYKFSMGFGYMINPNTTGQAKNEKDPSMSANMYKMFFNYSLSKAVTVTPEFVGDIKKYGKSGNGWIGMGITVRLF
jgi:hypothetical protein